MAVGALTAASSPDWDHGRRPSPLIAAIGAMVCALARRRIRERAISNAPHAPTSVVAARPEDSRRRRPGRAARWAWQRIVPVALFGFMAAQWAREFAISDTKIFRSC